MWTTEGQTKSVQNCGVSTVVKLIRLWKPETDCKKSVHKSIVST